LREVSGGERAWALRGCRVSAALRSLRKSLNDAGSSGLLLLRVPIAEVAAADQANRDKGGEDEITQRAGGHQPNEAVGHDAVAAQRTAHDVADRVHRTSYRRTGYGHETLGRVKREVWGGTSSG
jgi:hypothetical protein